MLLQRQQLMLVYAKLGIEKYKLLTLLERSIEIASLEFYFSKTSDERRIAWERMKSLIAQRSPERVREMEIQKGLREK